MAKTKAVQSGKIWENRRTREVLWGLMKLQKVQNGVLRIYCSKTKLDGEIGVQRGIFLTGARTADGSLTGYQALKKLLNVSEGNFTFTDHFDAELGTLDQNLKLRITTVINLWPDLPESLDNLSAKNTFTRMRAAEDAPREEEEIDQNVAEQLKAWEQKTMDFRAIVFWGLFVVVSSAIGIFLFFNH